MKIHFSNCTSLLPIALYGVCALSLWPNKPIFAATIPPATGVLFEPKATVEFETQGATAQLADENGAKVIKATFPGKGGYPAVAFPLPADGQWDLSRYSGVQVDVTNTGTGNVRVALRVDNAGRWQDNPFNTEATNLKPGETKTLKVTFGKSFGGNPGFALDPSKVVGIRTFVENPKQESTLVFKNLKAVGTASLTPLATTPVALPGGGVTPGALIGAFVDFSKLDAATMPTQGDTAVSIVGAGGAKVVQGTFPAAAGYPAFDFMPPNGSWNLSSSQGVQAEVTNTGTQSLQVAMRVDNAGDWKTNPNNTEKTDIKPGETKTLKVSFGKSFGNPAFALDPSKIIAIKIFAINPKNGGTVQVKNLQTFGTRDATATATATATTVSTPPKPAAATTPVGTNSPAIDGVLLRFDDKVLQGFNTKQSEVSVTTHDGKPALKLDFKTGADAYPNVQLPVPKGNWNLSSFGGLQAEVHNPGSETVRLFMRVDNPGRWQDEPWNTNIFIIAPGETKVISGKFGENNGAPGYALDPARVSAMQFFLERPKKDQTILLKSLRAFGSPQAGSSALSSPADRDKPVVPAAWLGKRPPVEGQWVQTLGEEFNGPKLNEKVWNDRTWWNSLIPGQTQRYSKDNLIFENGVLKMKIEKRRGHQYDDPTLPEMDYTTGHIVSYDKWTQRYGYFEARIKLPTARGLWPAFWMMPDRGREAGPEGWKRESTSNGGMEIDILEHLTEWGPGRNNVALHWDGYGKEHQSWGTSNIYYGPTPDGWHTYGVLWEPGKLTWFIDGIKKAEYENPRVSSVPAYMLLNVQMGAWATKDVDLAKLPDYYQIDWVRVWQTKERVAKP